jgi:cell division protein FtsI (penicillin-binding protein 3)
VNRWSKVSIGAISMGQEIGITPIQLAALVSTIANDGVWEAPRIVAGTTEPQGTPQTVVFHPSNERRVLSAFTAAQMKQMMQGVVLEGTGRKAILEGYSSAGKTGTAQKIDPATGTYSRTKYVGSFVGFAPVNNPVITVAVILDSPVGLHQCGQVSAPVFQRVGLPIRRHLHLRSSFPEKVGSETHPLSDRVSPGLDRANAHNQCVERIHCQLDFLELELPANRQLLLARRNAREDDLAESSPDHLGAALEIADNSSAGTALPPAPVQAPANPAVVAAALRQPEGTISGQPPPVVPTPSAQAAMAGLPSSGTVVLDVEQGGIVVPSFLGKSVRGAIEMAEESGLDLDVVGSGIAREQSPVPGLHVASGARVTVRFGR